MRVLRQSSFVFAYVQSCSSLGLSVCRPIWFRQLHENPENTKTQRGCGHFSPWPDGVLMLPSWSDEAQDLPVVFPHVLHAERVAPRHSCCRNGTGSGMYIFCPGFWLESSYASEQQSNIKWWGNKTEAISATNCSSRYSLKTHQTTLGSDSPFLSEQECYLCAVCFETRLIIEETLRRKTNDIYPSKTQARHLIAELKTKKREKRRGSKTKKSPKNNKKGKKKEIK